MDKLKVLFTNDAALIRIGLSSGFLNLGHEIYVMTGEDRLWDKDKDTQTQIFKRVVEQYKPSLVFSECFANFSEGIFEHTKEKGIFHAFWSIEDVPFTHWIGDHWAPYADHVFTTTAECLMNYWTKGIKADLLPFGVNKDFHKKGVTLPQYQNDIVLVANNYERRQDTTVEYLFPLIEQKYDIAVYGNEWWLEPKLKSNLLFSHSTYKGAIAYENLPNLYSSSKVALGINCDGDSYTQTSMRMFEVLGIGAGSLMVSPWTKGQEFMFHDHIYLARSATEMIAMVEDVLSMPEKERLKKSKEAQKFVYAYHNYDLRAAKVLDAYYRR